MAGRLPHSGSLRHRGGGLLHAAGWAYLVAASLLVWWLLSRRYPLLIPSPAETIDAIRALGAGRITHAVLVTLANSLTGYVLALLAALASMVLAYANRHLEALFNATNTLAQSVSVLVWAIVFVMIFGVTSRKPPVLVAAAASYPVLLSSLMGAVRALDERLRLLARILGASRLEELAYFILPGVVPYLAAASRSAIGIALRISVVAEAFGSSGGVGYWLAYSYDIGYKEGVFAWALILVALMVLIDYAALRPLEGWASRWKLQ